MKHPVSTLEGLVLRNMCQSDIPDARVLGAMKKNEIMSKMFMY